MQFTRSLLLGSVAAISAVGASQAADLPSRKAAPAEYVKICDAQGAGFFVIPGTDTCLKIGGFARFRYVWVSTGDVYTIPTFKAGTAAVGTSSKIPQGVLDSTGFLARGNIQLDARTPTQWGTARAFVHVRTNNSSGLFADNVAAGAGSVTGNVGSTAVSLESAFIQFAGFSFGRVKPEIFFFDGTNDGLNQYGVSYFSTGVNMLSYTGTFGGGISATIGLEDRAGFAHSVNPGYVGNAPGLGAGVFAPIAAFAGNSAGITGGAVANGPLTWPVLAGNFRVDQSWGVLQVMGHVLQNAAVTTFAGGTSPNVTLTQVGWAIGAGVKINLPMIAKGDEITIAGAYSQGDLDASAEFFTSGNGVGRDLNGMTRIDRNLYVTPSAAGPGCAAGATTSACFRTEQTTAWNIYGHFKHYWIPSVYSEILGSYQSIMPGSVTKNTDWTLGGLSNAQQWRIGHYLAWNPVKDFEIGVEASYMNLNANLTGQNGAAPSAIPGALTGLTPKASGVMVMGHVQRSF